MLSKIPFSDALKFWLKLGFISFGGPAGQIAIMHEYLVEKKKWISESRFLHALNYCMLLPGPEAQQLATYIGWLMHGVRGGLAAGILFVLPATLLLLGMSVVYVTFGSVPWVTSVFAGLKPAVVAIVVLAMIKIGKKSLTTRLHMVVAAGAFVAIFFFKIPFPLIILGTVACAVVVKKFFPDLIHSPKTVFTQPEPDETGYAVNKHSITLPKSPVLKGILIKGSVGLLLWALPVVLLFLVAPDFSFWQSLVLFFSKAALVTFGGAYAVLPYVAQVSVEKFHWLTSHEMIDGLALGETTPGPLVIVLAFVGFMAGYNQFEGSLLAGAAGLIITTYYTFLPSFLFIFIGAPVIELSRENKQLTQILSLVTAAVTGVVLNLTLYLGKAVFFPDNWVFTFEGGLAIGWALISCVAMYRFKVNMIAWIGISAVYGIAAGFFLN